MPVISSKTINRVRSRVAAKLGICESCDNPMAVEMIHEVEDGTELAELSLEMLGVPSFDIVKIDSQSTRQFVLLNPEQESQFDG